MCGMLSAYRPLFAVPGAPRFILGALISRVGGAMFGVAVIVMVSSRRDSYAIAGAISAVGVLVLAIAAPVLGRLIDKHGQRRIALPAILLTSVALFTTTCLSAVGAPLWTLFVAYAVSALLPEVGPMSRARCAHIMRDDPKGMHTAFAFEQVVEEFAFVVGPVLGVLAATTIAPEAGLVLAQILFAGGAILFLAARSTEPPVVPHDDRPPGLAINRPGMVIVPLVLFMVGVLFRGQRGGRRRGLRRAGRKAFSSTILAAFALGSAISGIVVGTRDFTTSVIKRFVLLAAAMCVLQAPVLLTDNLWALVGIMFVAGSATAPMLITSLGLVQRLVPHALVTEGMAVAVTGVLIGISAGTAVGGWLVEGLGAHPAYVLPVGATAVAAVIAYLGRGRVRQGLQGDVRA